MKRYPLNYGEFKEGLKQGKLLGLKCLGCGEAILPPRATCTACGKSDLQVVPFSPKGSIRTFTVIRVGPENFEAPYIVAMVELEEGPWVLGTLTGLPVEQAGMDLCGKPVTVGSKFFPSQNPEGGLEGAALEFELA